MISRRLQMPYNHQISLTENKRLRETEKQNLKLWWCTQAFVAAGYHEPIGSVLEVTPLTQDYWCLVHRGVWSTF